MTQKFPDKPVKIIVYVRGGMCQDVVTNLPDESWEYALADYDNEPDLPDDYVPFTKTEMKILPSMAAVFDLIGAASRVIENWESGDLAGAPPRNQCTSDQVQFVPAFFNECDIVLLNQCKLIHRHTTYC